MVERARQALERLARLIFDTKRRPRGNDADACKVESQLAAHGLDVGRARRRRREAKLVVVTTREQGVYRHCPLRAVQPSAQNRTPGYRGKLYRGADARRFEHVTEIARQSIRDIDRCRGDAAQTFAQGNPGIRPKERSLATFKLGSSELDAARMTSKSERRIA